MSDELPPALRDLYLARYRACVTEADAIAKALGLAPRRTEEQWRRQLAEPPNGSIHVVIVEDRSNLT